jgi:Protein of unknown function (DUF998)
MFQMLVRDGFDIRRHALSLLTNGDLGWIQILNFVLTGLLVIAGGDLPLTGTLTTARAETGRRGEPLQNVFGPPGARAGRTDPLQRVAVLRCTL